MPILVDEEPLVGESARLPSRELPAQQQPGLPLARVPALPGEAVARPAAQTQAHVLLLVLSQAVVAQ